MSDVVDALPRLLQGAWVTVQITIGGALVGLLAAVVAGLAGTSRRRAVRAVGRVYVEFFRGTSAIIQMYWFFFAFPLLVGYQLTPKWAGVLALGLNTGAYGAEVVRGSINAVPRAQYEATVALSMTPSLRMRRVILPQATVEMLPPFNNLLIELLKGTALVSLITVVDMTFVAQTVRDNTGDSTAPFLTILAMYFVLAYAMTLGMRWLERRAARSVGRGPAAVPREVPVPLRIDQGAGGAR